MSKTDTTTENLIVSGNIIDELSDKIPNYLVAINELIKNSYDANADNVRIIISTENKTIEISDDGDGMDDEGIKNLLHISKSYKNYASLNTNGRYTQGSKGLGFLAAFKFGEYVTWSTKYKDSVYRSTFSINFNDLIAEKNISDYNVDITKTISSDKKGTKIIMNYSGETNDLFISDIINQKNETSRIAKRILNSFENNKMNIEINIDGNNYVKEEFDFHTILDDRILFNVKFSNSELNNQGEINKNKNLIFFEHNNVLAHKIKFDHILDNTIIELDLVYYYLYSHAVKEFDNLYLDPNNQIAPLIYVNDNLFENYDLFDPTKLTYKRSGDVSRQFIGIINIKTENKSLDFNSDRTQMIDNTYTRELKEYLNSLNITIQQWISENKNELVSRAKNSTHTILTTEHLEVNETENIDDIDFSRYIKEQFSFKDKVSININKQKKLVTYSIFNKDYNLKFSKVKKSSRKQTKKETVPAIIQLTKSKDTISIPSEQIDLKTYIKSATDSESNKVSLSEISILVDGSSLPTAILPSVNEEKTVEVLYHYNDKTTGDTQASLEIQFSKKYSKVMGASFERANISFPGDVSYTINYSSTVSEIINQINSLDRTKYAEVILCSLRSIFEISISEIRNKYNKLLQDENGNNLVGLSSQVTGIIKYVISDNKLKNQISQSLKIRKDTFDNILSKSEIIKYENIIDKVNLPAHSSSKYMKNDEFIDLLDRTGHFVVITNEIIKCKKLSK